MQPPRCPVVPAGVESRGNIEVRTDYTFAVVEFDDAGQFYDRRQLACLMQELHREVAKQPLVLATYVPGWKSEDTPDDQDYRAFRQVLHDASAHPVDHPLPRIVGIYVGWRGKAIKGSPRSIWQNISYFNRKAAANDIAEGEARTLFTKLTLFQEKQNRRRRAVERTLHRPWVRQILMGHSFGGAIVFNAISAYLIRAVADTESDNGQYKTFLPGGLVAILINPSFSAARYTALYNLASHRCYSPYQRPVLLALTARNDWPDKLAFPAGQMLRPSITLPRQDNPAVAREEYEARRTALGFFQPYINRQIDYVDGRSSAMARQDAGSDLVGETVEKCPLPNNAALEQARPYIVPYGEWTNVAHHWRIRHLQGDPLNPFWVATVDPRILNGHSVSFTPPFTDLLTDLFQDLTTYEK